MDSFAIDTLRKRQTTKYPATKSLHTLVLGAIRIRRGCCRSSSTFSCDSNGVPIQGQCNVFLVDPGDVEEQLIKDNRTIC